MQETVIRQLSQLAAGINWSDSAIEWEGMTTDRSRRLVTPWDEFQRVLNWDGDSEVDFVIPVWSESHFTAGRLSESWALRAWDIILNGHPRRDFIQENLRGIRPSRYFQHFKGAFMATHYDCDTPPDREFENHWPPEMTSTGQTPEDWVWEKVQKDVETGAIECVDRRPRVVLPLSCEVSKPRLITDARFINRWTQLGTFRLDSVGQVPDTFRHDGYLTNYDHKSGYHHFLFEEAERGFFGFKLRGKYFVFAAGCFGWSLMPEIYHETHMALLQFCQRHFAIPSLGYLDDGLVGSLFGHGTEEARLQRSARWAVVLVGWMNFLAGYSISLKKSVLQPTQSIIWLGIRIDARENRFFIPEEKKTRLLRLIMEAVSTQRMSIRSLESITGKCMSLRVAVGEAAHVYTRALYDALVSMQRGGTWGHRGTKDTVFSIKGFPRLLRSLSVWLQAIDLFDGAPWMEVAHSTLRIQTDASGRRWGGVLKDGENKTVLSVGQEFDLHELELDIETKEAMAVVRTLMGIAEVKDWAFLSGKRLNLWIDNLALTFCLAKGASKNMSTHAQLELLFWLKIRFHFATTAIWWDTKANYEADEITRTHKGDDWRLCSDMFRMLWIRWGAVNMDLMASAVNVQQDLSGQALPFFSRFWCPGSAGIDLLAQELQPGQYYAFPHYKMVRAVVAHLASMKGVRLVLIVAQRDVSWLPRARTAIRDRVSLPRTAVIAADGGALSIQFDAFLLEF